jgi:hypothetical protein
MKTERLQCTGTRQWLTCGLTLSLHPEALVLAIFPTVWPYLGAWLVGLLMCMDVCPTCRLPCSRLCMRSTVDLVSNLSLWQQARCFLGLTRAKFFDERAAHCSTTHIELPNRPQTAPPSASTRLTKQTWDWLTPLRSTFSTFLGPSSMRMLVSVTVPKLLLLLQLGR